MVYPATNMGEILKAGKKKDFQQLINFYEVFLRCISSYA